MSANELAQKAVSKMNKRITNEVFLIIQNDRALMHEYLELVHQIGAQSVNQQIGKAVKEAYGLENDSDREDNPACTLIQSHQKFV